MTLNEEGLVRTANFYVLRGRGYLGKKRGY
jgi:hypothetical protein